MGQALRICKNCDTPRNCDTCPALHDWIMEALEEKAELADYHDLGPVDHLRELVQAERDRLIPPCKRGDVVYCIRHKPHTGYLVKELTVCTVTVWGPGQFSIFTTKEDVLGKTVFLSREEAEAALEAQEGNTDG